MKGKTTQKGEVNNNSFIQNLFHLFIVLKKNRSIYERTAKLHKGGMQIEYIQYSFQ